MASVPISPQALSWAIAESGISKDDIEVKLKLPSGTVDSWLIEDCKPNRTQFKRLKQLLKRPAAIFFMDTPPPSTESAVSMRYAFGATSRSRSPEERVAIRNSFRVGRFVGSLWKDLGRIIADIPSASTNENPEEVADMYRTKYLDVSLDEQMSWPSAAEAFRRWRSLIESMDILVFLYPLGEDSARGFSFTTEFLPVIGVSTAWHASIRVYTLFHELGHLITRTDSSCIEDSGRNPTEDPIERWCEIFATSCLMPRHDVQAFTAGQEHNDPVQTATWLANKLHVSRKAALLCLIENGQAQWADFRRLESGFEKKRSGAGGNVDQPRTRQKVRQDTYGNCLAVVRDAHQAKLVTEADIRTYLLMDPDELQ